MQINSNEPSFRAAQFTPRALTALSKRLPSGKFDVVKDRFIKMYENSPLDVVVDTVAQEAIRLNATIKEINPKNYHNMGRDYLEEGIFSSTFRSPEKFLKKLCEKIDTMEVNISGKLSRADKGV